VEVFLAGLLVGDFHGFSVARLKWHAGLHVIAKSLLMIDIDCI